MLDLKVLHQKLEAARREVRNLTVMQMRPDQSSEKLEMLRDLERSARAEVKARLLAIEHAQSVK
jgi:hypothetical protein